MIKEFCDKCGNETREEGDYSYDWIIGEAYLLCLDCRHTEDKIRHRFFGKFGEKHEGGICLPDVSEKAMNLVLHNYRIGKREFHLC